MTKKAAPKYVLEVDFHYRFHYRFAHCFGNENGPFSVLKAIPSANGIWAHFLSKTRSSQKCRSPKKNMMCFFGHLGPRFFRFEGYSFSKWNFDPYFVENLINIVLNRGPPKPSGVPLISAFWGYFFDEKSGSKIRFRG